MIIDTQKWQEIFTTLGQHKLRTALTAFGVFWGIFMLTVLLGAGKGLENGIEDGFPRVPNIVWLWVQGTTQVAYKGMPLGRQITLKPEDVTAIEQNVPSVGYIRGQNSVGIWSGSPPYTTYKDKNGTFYVQGTHAGMDNIHSLKIVEGRSVNDIDDREKRKVAIIGTAVRNQLFNADENPIGKDITISGISFMVIGVFKSLASGDEQQEQEKIYIPNDTLRYAFNQVGWIGSFIVIPKPGLHARIAEQDVKRYLSEVKHVSPDDYGVFGSFNLQNEYDKIQGLFGGIAAFSWLVAIGTIMAGAIGVGNIMLIVVKERTREIGLRKALGATPSSITGMIVQESIFITTVAGYMGLVIGVLLLEGIGKLLDAAGGQAGFFGKPEVDFATALSALVVLVVSGLLASLLPAAKAASVNPIVALQDE
ncbi:ABC transporter permease [Cellvibrio japonicus]|nr:ABC transporter permease [Cellvibrio japonicus]QEI10791.1 ABC transporter permease [Cellvibrio japonicus]QEI14367.1 ABC transporter permease [Cellvibrio japonicus]QEI17945.1 ABC transporter permease [Cellvibrio japonicus]